MLLCLWTPGPGGVPTLPVRSPLSGLVGVLPQSTTVTLLSLLWLGLLLVLVWFHYLRLDAVGFGLCWSARLSGLLPGRC